MKIILTMQSDYGKQVTIEQNDVDYIQDYLETVLSFTKAIGYDYVEHVGVIKHGKEEEWTQ